MILQQFRDEHAIAEGASVSLSAERRSITEGNAGSLVGSGEQRFESDDDEDDSAQRFCLPVDAATYADAEVFPQ